MLFRAEAIQAQHARLEGHVVIPEPGLLRISSTIFSLSLIALGLIVTFGSYAPRQTVVGFLAPERGLAKVFATRAGKTDSVSVQEGDQVRLGQTLALISVEQGWMDSEGQSVVERILSELTEQERRLNEGLGAEENTSKSNQSRASSRIGSLKQELQSAEAEKAALEQEKQTAEAVIVRIEQLKQAGYVTEVEIAARRQQILGLERQSHALAKAVIMARNQLKDAEAELKQQPFAAERSRSELLNRISEVKRQIASYEVQRGYAVTAPISGRVTALQAERWKPVTPEQMMLAIVADDAVMEAHLLLPSRAIGFVAEGQEVRLRYAAFPYQHYGVHKAQVTEISRTTLRPEELAVGLPLTEPVYRVKVKLDSQTVQARGKEHSLQVGMLVEADILLEERSLWTWFAEPLLAFRGKV